MSIQETLGKENDEFPQCYLANNAVILAIHDTAKQAKVQACLGSRPISFNDKCSDASIHDVSRRYVYRLTGLPTFVRSQKHDRGSHLFSRGEPPQW
jgi:hypothetical protein